MPITLDYELLNGLLIQTSYTDPGQTAQLLYEGNGCLELKLTDPKFSGEAEVITLLTDVYIHLGTPLGDSCLMPYQWNGSMQVSQIPRLDSQSWDLTFQTVDTKIFSADGAAIESFDMVFQRLLPLINEHMQAFSIKLANPVEDLRTFILPMFTPDARVQAKQLLDSIRPGAIIANQTSLIVNIHADATELDSGPEAAAVETLSEEEMEDFLDLWETWDSLLVFLVSVLSETPLSSTNKQQLIDLLLETRYEFVTRINDTSVQKDFVRDQFLEGWQLLSTIFRNQLLENPAESRIGYLSFLTAGDALMILDELGPAFGIEISRNGLIRLAKILGGEGVELHYSPDINKSLQMLFQAFPENQQNNSDDEQETPQRQETSRLDIFQFLESLLPSSAFAAKRPSFTEIKRWQAPKNNFDDYLERISDLLEFAYTSLVIRRQLPDNFNALYRAMIPAIAWQESCFKQFVVKDSKLTYLLSYNNSSVGLMQVNERVWRGIYDTQRLRWDIRYNASAGCEIVDLYLQKYALRKYGPEILKKTDTLAQLVYAMYNGGPSQFDKFLKRSHTNKLYDSDRLFAQKYEWVKKRDWEQAEKCF
ncbi:MAG: lytic transglycosylase domain-containing protein [Desulfofustis sp.]|nr:lytic transglycosylase domain-containing protein [Desulfofustis sp.]